MPQARVPRVFSRVRRTDLHACKSLCHASRAFLRHLEPRLSAGWTLGLHWARLLVRWEKPLAATPDTSWFPTTLPKILEQYTHLEAAPARPRRMRSQTRRARTP